MTPNIERARALRRNMTDAERALWRNINRRQVAGGKFRRQQVLGAFIADFVCLEKRLIVEIDGGQHAAQIAQDEARSRWLDTQGFRALRFWNNEVLGNMSGVLHVIHEAVRGAKE